MRPIKFRAFTKAEKKIYTVSKIDFEFQSLFLLGKNGSFGGFLFSEVELMQFTGFLDKNGKEVFEGDVVKLPAGNMRVSFSDGAFVLIPPKTNVIYEALGLIEDEYKIIGNIHENPEL